MRQSNYEITKEKMAKHFLDFDQGTMISRMHLRHDSRYLYIRFVGRWYRIDRSSGLVQWSEDGFRHGIEGDFNEAMSIYDLLCCSKEGCCLAGEFVKLRGSVAGGPGGELFASNALWFQGKSQRLALACECLGGVRSGKGMWRTPCRYLMFCRSGCLSGRQTRIFHPRCSSNGTKIQRILCILKPHFTSLPIYYPVCGL